MESATAFGERTLPGTIDQIASSASDRVWARYPVSQEAFKRGELRSVTFKALGNAINRLAWHLDTSLPRLDELETICYIGPSDIRYFILACAACKRGAKVRCLNLKLGTMC